MATEELSAALLEALLLAAVYALLGWAFPALADDPATLDEVRRRALERIFAWGNLAVLALWLPAGLLVYRALRAGARGWRAGPGVEHVLLPGWIFWALPAMLLGVLVAGALVELAVAWKLGEGYGDFRQVTSELLGFDSWRGGLAVGGLCLALALAGAGLLASWVVVLTRGELRLGHPFAPARVVPLAEVRSIQELRPGVHPRGERRRVVSEPFFRVEFGPGEEDSWESGGFHGPRPTEEVRAAMADLAAWSGVPVEVVEPPRSEALEPGDPPGAG